MTPHDHAHDSGDTIAYGLGLLDDPDEVAAVEHTLTSCDRCLSDYIELGPVSQQLLSAAPLMEFMDLDGDPDADRPSDEPLAAALSRIRADQADRGDRTDRGDQADRDDQADRHDRVGRAGQAAPAELGAPLALDEHRARRRRPGRGLIAAAALLVAIAGGAGVGRLTAPTADVVAQPQNDRGTSAGPTVGAGTVVAQGRSGAAVMTATLTPADGWVRVSVDTTGIEPGRLCEIVVQADDGSERIAGSWEVGEAGAQPAPAVEGAAVVDLTTVSTVLVRDATTGEQLVAASV